MDMTIININLTFQLSFSTGIESLSLKKTKKNIVAQMYSKQILNMLIIDLNRA